MSDDRNEGECYGPFHAGFVCEDCADRYRALEAARAKPWLVSRRPSNGGRP